MMFVAKVAGVLALTATCAYAHGPDCHPTAKKAAMAMVYPSLRDYGVAADGGDQTVHLQAAVLSSSLAGTALYWNSGNYRVSAAIPIFSNTKFVTDCATCVTITNTNDAAWTLEFNSAVGEASYPLRVGIEIRRVDHQREKWDQD